MRRELAWATFILPSFPFSLKFEPEAERLLKELDTPPANP
jgi:hypothetical protein